MAADDLSLLFRLRGDASGVKAASAEARAAVNQLRQTFGPELTQAAGVSQKAFESIGNSVENLIRQQLPLLGNVAVSVTSGLRDIGEAADKDSEGLDTLAEAITAIARESKKSTAEIAAFLTKFVQIEGQAQRDAAAVEFFGAALGAKLIPKLEKTGTELATAASATTSFRSAIAGLATPIGITVLAIAGATAAVGLLTKQIFELSRNAADFQGKLFDLSQQTGVNVETLSALEVAARTTGGSIDSIAASLGIFQRKLEESQDPASQAAALFRQLSVDSTNTEEALRHTLAAIQQLPEGFQQTAIALELFGRGGRQMLAILKETEGDLDRAIDRFRELGILIDTDAAKAADRFNDQLALVQFQLRAVSSEIAREAIPIVLDALREFSITLKDNREAIRLLGKIVGVLALALNVELRRALIAVNIVLAAMHDQLKPLQVILESIAELYERIAAAANKIPFIRLPSLGGTSGGRAVTQTIETAQRAATPADSTSKQLKTQLQIQRELLELQKAALDEEVTIAAERINNAERAFKRGELTRRQELDSVLDNNKRILEAELNKIARERDLKVTEGALAQADIQKREEIAGQLARLDQRANELRAQARQQEANKRAEFQEAERKELVAHQERLLEIASRLDAARILSIEASVKAGNKSALEAAKEIEHIENVALDREQALLARKLQIAGIEIEERRKIADQIRLIEAQRTELAEVQAERRRKIIEEEFERERQLRLDAIDTALQLEELRGQRIIDTINSLAAAGVIAEEAAARKVLALRLQLIDDEIEATNAKLAAAAGIGDAGERTRAQAEANNRLKILTEQRISIEVQGQRDIEAGRQSDLENERQYADELRDIRERIVDIERDTARSVIDQMVSGFARRKDIIRAQAELEIGQAEDRHRRNRDDIRRERSEIADRLGAIQGFLSSLGIVARKEIDVYAETIKARVEALTRQRELNEEEREELAQHQTVLNNLRGREEVEAYQRAVAARASALERQKDLNDEEQEELRQHQAILEALRAREERSLRATQIEARIEMLREQGSLNREEQAELESHQSELKRIRQSDDLEIVIERRIAVLSQQKELNTQEQAELRNHYAVLNLIRGRAGVDIYARELQARVNALQQQGELNSDEQAELTQHQAILNAIRRQGEQQTRSIELQGRIEILQRQKVLNAEEQRELEQHQAELKQIREQAGDVENVIQKRVDFLRQQQILNAQEQAELKQHEAVLRAIRGSGTSFEAAIRARIKFLESQETLNAQEREELQLHRNLLTRIEDRSNLYADAIRKRIAFLEKQKELNAEEKAELVRHQAEIDVIERQQRLALKEADPVGRLELDVDNLNEFKSVIEDSIVPLGEVLTRTFLQVADAIGQTVANWVLLGETGPAVMRKILAQALASIAAEAAVNAIKELALGFATLFFNPAESAAHFKAAALWAAVGGVAAGVGRGVAGNLFKPTAGGGAVGAGGRDRGELNPLTLQRNAGPGAPQQFAPQIQPQRVEVRVTVNDGRFADAIKTTVIDDINNRGPIGEIIANDGNLNRG